MADEGLKVCVLEKNKQLGGNLQIFARDKRIFDTGVHYIGGFDKGQNLYQYFKYLGIMDDLRIRKMDEDGFDHVSFEGDPNIYRYGQGYKNFVRVLSQSFPEEEEAIQKYVDKLREVCDLFPLYNVKQGDSYALDLDMLGISAKDFICSLTDNVTLQNVLAGTNILYAGYQDKTPLYVHALVTNSYIESSYRCVDGGSQICKLLVKRIRKSGGEIFKHQHVTEFVVEERQVLGVKTKGGRVFKGKKYISNIHPQEMLKMLPPKAFRKPYRERIQSLENTTSVFCLHLVLKENCFPYLNHNVYHYDKVNDVWDGMYYSEEEWPKGYMLSTPASSKNEKYADSITIMTYMNYEDVKDWTSSYNVVGYEEDRGGTYDKFKEAKAQKLLNKIYKKFPELKGKVLAHYTSTPLTYRDYIGNGDGSLYGIIKDYHDPLKTFISPKTKVSNLFLTGQNLNMHGILGVTIGAIVTCASFIGLDKIMGKVAEANRE